MTHDKHQAFFDKLANEWDLHYTAEDLERLSNQVNRFGIKPDMDILDIGCATGVLFDLIRRKVGKNGSVTGIDFSLAMVLQAHRNFPFPNVNVVDADAVQMPFKDDTFDMAVAFSSFPHISDKLKALRETHRVLKADAHLYIIHLSSSRNVSEHHHKSGGVLVDDELPTREKMTELLESAGFSGIKIEDTPNLYLASAKVQK